MWNVVVEVIGELFISLFALSVSKEDKEKSSISKVAGYIVTGIIGFIILAAIYNNMNP